MAAYMFQILKMNIIAATIVAIAMVVSHMTSRRYSCRWKYFMWLAVALFLLIPADFPKKSLVKVRLYPKKQETLLSRGGTVSDELKRSVFSQDVLEILFVVWVAGIVILAAARILRYYFSMRDMLRWSYPVTDERVLQQYRKICRENHVKKPPRLMVSARLSTPVLAGLFHTGLDLTQEPCNLYELRFVYSHELCHYRHKDLWYKTLLLLISTIHWFNPCLYWMQKEAEKDIESLCDTAVVKTYTNAEKKHYNRILLRTAAVQNQVPYLAAGLNDGPGIFKKRILYMRNLSSMKENFFWAVLLAAAMLLSNILIGSAVQPVQARQSAPAKTENLPESGPEFKEGKAEEEKPVSFQSDTPGIQPEETIAKAGEKQETQQNAQADPAGYESGKESEEAGSDAWENTADPEEELGEDGPEIPQGETAEQKGITLTEEQYTLWTEDYGSANYVYHATDGNWYDGSGREYEKTESGSWESQGKTWTEETPQAPEDTAVNEVQVADGPGDNQQTLYQDSDGNWANGAGGVYIPDGNGGFTGPDGSVWN